MKYFSYFRALIIIIISFQSLAQNIRQTLQLLDEYDPYQKLETQVQNTRTGYGFWFKYIALKKIFSTHSLTEGLDQNDVVKGQIMCFSQGDQFEILLYFMENFDNYLINLKFIINSNQEFLVNYKYYDFEGIWIFAAVSLDPIKSTIEVYLYNEQALNNFIYNKFQLTTQIPQMVNSYLGGYARVQNMNLLPFTAKISEFQIIEVFDQIGSNFQQFNQKIIEAQIFERIKPKEQRILLVDEQHFNGSQYLVKTIFMDGSTFLIQGWVKLNEQVKDYGFILVVISYSNLQYTNRYPGDQILTLRYQISSSGRYGSQFSIIQQFNQNPNVYEPYIYCGSEITQYMGQSQVYHQLISWHYIQYQLGNKEQPSSIYLYFSYDQSVVYAIYQLNFSPYEFSNVNATIFISGATEEQTYMNGQITNLEFIHSYEVSKPFLTNCHTTCFSCLGPYENQCLNCNPIYNRVHLPFKNICACDIGYIESFDSLNCITLQQSYATAMIVVQKEDENEAIKCKLGYFEFLNSCLPCPFGNRMLNCLDCINNQKEWFLNPICNWDFNQIFFSFRYAQREQEFRDLYLINQPSSIQLCDGCASFCNPVESDCNKLLGAFHLGVQAFVKCKPNFKFINGACKLNPPFCLLQNSEGICIECLSQYYFDLDQQNCVECPQECQTCHYDEIVNNVMCDSCSDKSSLILNGVCERCGLNCKICQLDFNFKKQEPYLRCLECIDVNKYYIMFNAIDCLEITINYCQYGFQYLETDYSITTLDTFFEPRDYDENVRVGCARCYDDSFTYDLITNQCVYTAYQYGMCKQSVFDYSGTYVCLTIYDKTAAQQKVYSRFSYCPLIDKCLECLKINEYNQICLDCDYGYYSSYTGVCIKCPAELNCFRCQQILIQFNDNFRKELRAFYKFFVEESNQSHFYNDYNQKFQKEQYMVQCIQCFENQELYNGKCIKACPQYCQSCIKSNDENVCQSCPFTYLGKILSVVDNNCLECPTFCQICIKRTQSEVAAINPYYSSQSQIYQNICIKGFSNLYFYDEDLQSFQDCSFNPDQQRCFISITIDVKIYCQDDFVSYKNQVNIKDLFSSSSNIDHLPYFENEKLYAYANKNTVKEVIYNFEIVDGLEHSCRIPREGYFQQNMSKNVFSAIIIKLKFYSSQQSDLYFLGNFDLLGFTEIIISNLSFISSSNLIATITLDSLFKLRTTFQSVNFGSLNLKQQIKIVAGSQQSIEFRDIQFINLLLTELNSQFILIKTNLQPTLLILDNVKFLYCDFMNIIVFNLLNQNSVKIYTSNLQITNMVLKNSTYIKLLDINDNNEMIMEHLNLNLLIIDSSAFFNFIYFYQIKVKQTLLQDSTLVNTVFFSLNNFIEMEDFTLSEISLKTQSTLFQSGYSYIKEPQFILNKISFNLIKYEKEVPLINVGLDDQMEIKMQLVDIQIQNSKLKQIELLNEIDISKNKIILSCKSIVIKNFLIIREEDLPEIAIVNSMEVIIDNLQIIQRKREKFLSFTCLDSSKFQQEYSLISFFEVRNINIQNSIFSNNTLYNQGILQIIYDQKMNLNQEIQQKVIIFNQVKFESNLLLKNLNQNALGLINIIDQNQIVIHFSELIFQGNLLNEFLEESQSASSLLIVAIAPRGYFSLITSSLEYNLILNSTVSLLYINTKSLNIAYTLFNNNNVMNYTTLNYFIKDLAYSITSIYSQSGNGYLKTSSLLVNNVHLNTSQGFYGGGFQISSQNISTLTFQNCQFSNLSNLIGNSLSYGAAIYLEIQSQEIIMQFINISVSQVFTQNLGGFLFIKSSIYQKIQIDFQNSFFQDNYADLGSILYFDNSINSNQQLCKLSLTEIIVEQSNYQTYFENLKFDNQNQIDNALSKQRQLINLKMCSIELKNSFFVNLIQEGIINVEQPSEIILANLLVDNANIVNQQLINILSYSDIHLTNIQVLNTSNSFNYKSNKEICKINSSTFNDCAAISQITDLMRQIDCSYKQLIFSSQLSASTLINIVHQITTQQIFFKNITFMNNQINELVNINALVKQQNATQIIMDTLFSHQNLCLNSCFTIQPLTYEPNEKIVSKDVIISNYYCIENTAQQGGCLNVYEFQITVLRSNFINNTAKYKGGAIYYEGKYLVFEQSQIYNNKAQQGGGVFTNIQLPIFIEQQTFKANQASYFGNDIVEIPSKLGITIDNYRNILFPTELVNNELIQLDQIKIQNYILFDGSITNFIYFPSGQQIGQYQYFDYIQNKYINANLTLRVVALNRQYDIMRDLSNSYCTIFNDDPYSQFQIKAKFNQASQDFNFDDQIFTFTPYTEQPLLLKIKCNCVKVLNNTITNLQNYQIQLQVKTFTCKIGEIFDRDQCKACDYTQDLYSVTIKSTKCSKRNELTTSQVTSGQLKLRQGFWRYHQNSDDILQCSYSQTKCKGGWETADASCEIGYVGALCEQCDIYGTRGSEKFQNLFKYSCQQCSSQRYTIFYYIILNIWNILAIGITAFCIKNDFNKMFRVFWFSTISCNKIFLHYFQIIFYLTMLKLNIPIQLSSIINFLGNPTESISFSLDCVWSNYETTFNIIYIRAIIQIFSPILYLIIIGVFIVFIFRKESETRQHLIFNSLQYCKLYYSPSIFSCLVSLVSYRVIGGKKWILADVTYIFDSQEHYLWILQFIIPIFILFLIILALDFVAIFQRKQQLTLLKTKMMFGYLYLNYKILQIDIKILIGDCDIVVSGSNSLESNLCSFTDLTQKIYKKYR